MRNDNLIGLHLLLNIIQEVLVLEMINRDKKKDTNFHRYGNNEKLPDLLDFNKLNYDDKHSLLDYIENLGRHYDRRVATHFPQYESRFEALKISIDASYDALK